MPTKLLPRWCTGADRHAVLASLPPRVQSIINSSFHPAMRNAMQAAVADQKAQGQGPSHQSLTRDELAKRVRREHASKVVDPAAELAAIHSAEDENALPGRPQKTGFRASTEDQGGRKEPDYHTVVAKHEHLKEDKLVIRDINRHYETTIPCSKTCREKIMSSFAEFKNLVKVHAPGVLQMAEKKVNGTRAKRKRAEEAE